jgi:probable phosphoglycerate mutase
MFEHPFYAMRHGETSWNARGFFQGHSDVPLSSEGERQVHGNARRLGVHCRGIGVDPSTIDIVSSPLSRALHSARIVCAELGVAQSRLTIDPRLKEASFGRWEGLTTLEVKERFRRERRQRKEDRWNFAPPGGQSYADISSAMQDFLAGMSHGRPSLIVTHTGNIRVALRLLQGLEPETAMATAIPQGRVLCWDGSFAGWI